MHFDIALCPKSAEPDAMPAVGGPVRRSALVPWRHRLPRLATRSSCGLPGFAAFGVSLDLQRGQAVVVVSLVGHQVTVGVAGGGDALGDRFDAQAAAKVTEQAVLLHNEYKDRKKALAVSRKGKKP